MNLARGIRTARKEFLTFNNLASTIEEWIHHEKGMEALIDPPLVPLRYFVQQPNRVALERIAELRADFATRIAIQISCFLLMRVLWIRITYRGLCLGTEATEGEACPPEFILLPWPEV
jgi:hypothetical protein